MTPVVVYDACVLYPAPLRDLAPASLDRCRRLMDAHVPDCLVSGYEALIPTLTLPDPDDRHVLAAAIHAGAQVIVTFDLGDFPAPVLDAWGIEAVHPDEFLTRLWDESAEAVIDAAKLQRAGLKNPPKTAAEYLATLVQCRLPELVAKLGPHADQI